MLIEQQRMIQTPFGKLYAGALLLSLGLAANVAVGAPRDTWWFFAMFFALGVVFGRRVVAPIIRISVGIDHLVIKRGRQVEMIPLGEITEARRGPVLHARPWRFLATGGAGDDVTLLRAPSVTFRVGKRTRIITARRADRLVAEFQKRRDAKTP